MRSVLLVCLSIICFAVPACSKSAEKISSPVEKTETADIGNTSVNAAELEKLQRVFSKLSERTRQGIVNGDAAEFLADLYTVLESDTDNLLLLVDKSHFLSPDYVPEDIIPLVQNDFYLLNRADLSLRVPVELALRKMSTAARNDGITLLVSSTYRSYDYQTVVYERNVREMGKEAADRESAAPGTSQHQLGTVIDFGSITDDFAETAAGKWLDTYAGDFGWSLSFPQGYEDITGYRWECWHYRYIGVPAVQFQKKWFSNIQQFMLEFIHAWREDGSDI